MRSKKAGLYLHLEYWVLHCCARIDPSTTYQQLQLVATPPAAHANSTWGTVLQHGTLCCDVDCAATATASSPAAAAYGTVPK